MKIRNNISYRAAKYIENNKKIQSILRYADKNPSLTESLFVTTLAIGLRPVTIAACDTDKDSKRFYISRSIISGILDLTTNILFFVPIQKWTQMKEKILINTKGTIFHNNKENVGSFKYIINRGFKFAVLPINAFLLFWAIPKTVDKWFPIKKKDK